MNEVENYIMKHNGMQKDLLMYFHLLLWEDYGLKPKIAYGIPMYYAHKWVVYLNADKKKGVEVAFPRGHLLNDKYQLLESKGRKMVKSIEFFNIEEIPEEEIKSTLEEAIKIDNKLNGKDV